MPVLAAIGLATTAISAGASFVQANKQKKMMQEANAEAAKAIKDGTVHGTIRNQIRLGTQHQGRLQKNPAVDKKADIVQIISSMNLRPS